MSNTVCDYCKPYLKGCSMEAEALRELEEWLYFETLDSFFNHPQVEVSVMSYLCWLSVQAGGWTGCVYGCSCSSFSESGRSWLKHWVFHSPEQKGLISVSFGKKTALSCSSSFFSPFPSFHTVQFCSVWVSGPHACLFRDSVQVNY